MNILTQQRADQIYASMTNDEKSLVQSIRMANNLDEKSLIDGIIMDVQERRGRFFDIVYVDLSIDRSSAPLEISGAGTGIFAVEATDNNANLELSFEITEGSSASRLQLKRGKGFFVPFSKFYLYHSAQSGKYLKLMRVFSTKSIFSGYQDFSGESANADLVTALGNSSSFATAQVAMGVAAAVIKAANTARKRIIIKNPASNTVPVFVGLTNAVTISNGHCVDPGDALVLSSIAAIYGIVQSGTPSVTYLEE